MEWDGIDRRQKAHCDGHSSNCEKINEIDASVNRISGGLTVAKILVGLATVIIGGSLSLLITKVNSIETLLVNNGTSIAVQGTRIDALTLRVESIEKRHDYLDQNGIVKVKRP